MKIVGVHPTRRSVHLGFLFRRHESMILKHNFESHKEGRALVSDVSSNPQSEIEIHTVRISELAPVPAFFAYSRSPIIPRLIPVSGSAYKYKFAGLRSRCTQPASWIIRRARLQSDTMEYIYTMQTYRLWSAQAPKACL